MNVIIGQKRSIEYMHTLKKKKTGRKCGKMWIESFICLFSKRLISEEERKCVK